MEFTEVSPEFIPLNVPPTDVLALFPRLPLFAAPVTGAVAAFKILARAFPVAPTTLEVSALGEIKTERIARPMIAPRIAVITLKALFMRLALPAPNPANSVEGCSSRQLLSLQCLHLPMTTNL